MTTPPELLKSWLDRQLDDSQRTWLEGQLERLARDRSPGTLDIALGMAPRKLGRDDLALAPDDMAAAYAARTDWDPRGWTVDAAARVLFLLAAPPGNAGFAGRLRELCRYGDVAETIAYYRGLPVYPDPETLVDVAGEGVRTNMRAVFEAIAHNNPYPRDHFDEARWNQMVLKALFIDSTLAPIIGLDERANPELAQILRDYAHERWAAGRTVSPELWRCVGPFADGEAIADLERAARTGDAAGRKAAALALAASPEPRARALLDELLPQEAAEVAAGRLAWQDIGAA